MEGDRFEGKRKCSIRKKEWQGPSEKMDRWIGGVDNKKEKETYRLTEKVGEIDTQESVSMTNGRPTKWDNELKVSI